MKCYSQTTRGIKVTDNAISLLKMPVILTESLLKAPHATFVDRLVFADAEVADGKIFLTAQASVEDERALVFYDHSESCSWDNEENVAYEVIAARAEVLHLKRESEYGWYGMYSDVQRMALVIEPGGHALIKVKRIHKTKVGFWAGLFGAKSTAEEVLRHIEVGYDGNEITVQTVLEERRDVTRALPTEVAPRLITA